MGVRDICSSFLGAPSGYGVYRDTSGSYHYLANSANIETDFQISEFNTEGLTHYGVMKALTSKLQAMRTALGAAIVVNSGYRNPPTQYLNCGTDTSLTIWEDVHADGLAADIYCTSKTYVDVATAAHNAGFVRIEVIKPSSTDKYTNLMTQAGHIHVDVYDGSGTTTSGTMYDSPGSYLKGLPGYPWYAYGYGSDGTYTTVPTWADLLTYIESH